MRMYYTDTYMAVAYFFIKAIFSSSQQLLKNYASSSYFTCFIFLYIKMKHKKFHSHCIG